MGILPPTPGDFSEECGNKRLILARVEVGENRADSGALLSERSEEKDASQSSQSEDPRGTRRGLGFADAGVIPHPGCFCTKCAEAIEKKRDGENDGDKCAQAY